MKKVLSVIMVLAFVVSLSLTAFAAATDGTSASNAITIDDKSLFVATVDSGKTVWYVYEDMFLPMFGTYAQMINVSAPVSEYSVTDGVETVAADENGFANFRYEDKNSSGKYVFAITNNSEFEEKFYVSFSDALEHVFTGVDLEVGDNYITVDTSAPTALYSFSAGDVYVYDSFGDPVFDDNGDPVVIKGQGAGTYEISVRDKNGDLIEGALIGDWGTVGYPFDVTGDAKTNTFVWNTTEDTAQCLLGVSGVSEDFVLNVVRKGDYDDGKEKVVFEDYKNVHTPSSFVMPEGELVKVDMTTAQIIVLGEDGFYHMNTADGPVVFVDMVNDCIDLVAAYKSAYGAMTMRGKYVDDSGKTCGYEFINAMREYYPVLDKDGYYPLTPDLELFIKLFGASQGWFNESFSNFEDIKNGEYLEENAWLACAYYIPGSVSVETTPETDAITDAPSQDPSDDNVTTDAPADDDDVTNAPETEKAPVKAPQTGDNFVFVAFIAFIALVSCAVVVVVRRREN